MKMKNKIFFFSLIHKSIASMFHYTTGSFIFYVLCSVVVVVDDDNEIAIEVQYLFIFIIYWEFLYTNIKEN